MKNKSKETYEKIAKDMFNSDYGQDSKATCMLCLPVKDVTNPDKDSKIGKCNQCNIPVYYNKSPKGIKRNFRLKKFCPICARKILEYQSKKENEKIPPFTDLILKIYEIKE